MPKKTVCVIGAGCSGLPAIKACIEEGFDVVCYEQRSEIGGLWNYKEDIPSEWSTVMRSTVINTSKEMMAFSDYPPPEHFPNFVHNSILKTYIDEYARNFDLVRHVQFDTVVTKDSKEEEMNVFDGVMVACGHHSKPNIPTIAGIHKFEGTVKHSQAFKNSDNYQHRRVLIIGVGNSGLDTAVDLTKSNTNQVYVSTRRGSWIWNRVSKRGFPYDIFYLSKFMSTLTFKVFGTYLSSRLVEHMLNMRFDHEMYRLKPKHRFFAAHPTVNDALPNAIASGQIMIRGDVKDFTGNSVTFEDGTEAEIDEVILSTGYSFTFPFLNASDLLYCRNNEVDLYKYVFPPQLPHGTLSFIGYVQPMGAVAPISELQARWAAKVMSGSMRLPKEHTMRTDIKRKREAMARLFVETPRHTVQVHYVEYMGEIASIVGCNPFDDSLRLALSKPKLFYKLVCGPCLPYSFRLIGPNAWDGAENAVQTAMDRIVRPLIGKTADTERTESVTNKFYYFGKLSYRLFVAFFFLFCTLCYAYGSAVPLGFTVISSLAIFVAFFVADVLLDFSTFL